MLLTVLPFFGNNWCKECLLIPRFMKGLFNQTPPLPKYRFTWDVSVVLRYLASLYPLESLSLKLLTLKVTALIALAAAPRAQVLVGLCLDNMLVESDSVLFTFPNTLLKSSRVGHCFSLKVEHFQEENVCAMHTLLYYIKKTERYRLSRHVLVSYVTFRNVTTSTVARWLKCVLDLSGIDTGVFKAHSYRGAAVSAAFSRGCSLNSILSTADWSTDKNFRKFYFRHTLSKDNITFANAVLRR